MRPDFYRAAQSGRWEAVKDFSPDLYSERTANGNTILHVLAQSCDSSADVAVKHILEKRPDLSFEENGHLETPLIIASRRGHLQVVRALIVCAKENGDHRTSGTQRLAKMLGASDQHGNTALHEAVANNRWEIVKMLLEEVPDFSCPKNVAGKSPLYVAVEKGNLEIVTLIFSLSKSISYGGPQKKTALHAAAIWNCPECMKLILKEIPHITKEVNEIGWTALHFAAKLNHAELVKLLLSTDNAMGYIAAKDDSRTALHVAVTHGNLDVIREILLHCPDCWELITRKRQNILHLAVENEHKHVLEFILQSSWASELINKQDINGNTPLHLYVATKKLEGFNLVNHSCVDRNTFNNGRLTPLDMIIQKANEVSARQNSIRDELVKAGATPGLLSGITNSDENGEKENLETYIVAATLIITVTFAAGFTIPGGYNTTKGNEGMAVLSKNAAFSAFVVSDSLAMMLSIASVILQFSAIDKRSFWPKSSLISYSKICLTLAMTLMVIAFLSGLYAVVPVRALKTYLIVVCTLICLPIPAFCIFLVIQSYMQPEESVREIMFNSINIV